jgi:hypothetical protein
MPMNMNMNMSVGADNTSALAALGGIAAFSGTDPLTSSLVEPSQDLNDIEPNMKLVKVQEYPPRFWHPIYVAQAVLAEFSQTDWKTEADPGDWKRCAECQKKEIRYLVALSKDIRTRRQGEIIAQAGNAGFLWANLLMINPAATPGTSSLIEIGQAVGTMVAMHFKMLYKRPRPVQIYPTLSPLVPTPPHPSYPNAHALQALVISGLLATVRPDLKETLNSIAIRIGQNREIAGVHYPSDREASSTSAVAVLKILKKMSEISEGVYHAVHRRASAEWSEYHH